MKIILIGANGQLGSDLCAALTDHEVLPAVQPNTNDGRIPAAIELDLLNVAEVRTVVGQFKPDVIINTAAFHRVDDIERDASVALQVNGWAAQQLALLCHEQDVALLHISTDYVFDGEQHTPYVESDLPNPISAYGASKLAGELLVRAAWHRHYIIRPCGLYGAAGAMGKGGNFVNTMLRMAREGKPIRVVDDQICTPTYTRDLARQIKAIIECGQPGLYHTTNDGQCSWHEFACEIFRLAHMTPEVIPISSETLNLPARRPAYSVLKNQALQRLGIDLMRDWHEALAEYIALLGA
jgi:dTDP-4-dehydrorhamnose reductase